jgi:Ulp1 family protease
MMMATFGIWFVYSDQIFSYRPAEKKHARVKNWTKKVDLFEKDFIFVPINEQ